MNVNSHQPLDVRAEMNIQSPGAAYEIRSDGEIIQCTISGKGWKRDFWQLRQSLFRRTMRRRFSKRLHQAGLRFDVMHEGRLVARFGHGVGNGLLARMMGFEHGKIYVTPLMH